MYELYKYSKSLFFKLFNSKEKFKGGGVWALMFELKVSFDLTPVQSLNHQ